MDSILIFAGAGASKAVDPETYPTTVNFFEKLPEHITSQPAFQSTVSFLREGNPDKVIDIELLLWSLKELKEFFTKAGSQSDIAGWMIQSGHIHRLANLSSSNLGNFQEIARFSLHGIENLIDAINQRVYDLYGRPPSEEQLAKTWRPLLKGCSSITKRVEVITTNYDVVIESALGEPPIVDLGWKGSVFRTLDRSLWERHAPERSRGLLTKLHGSVHWGLDGETVYAEGPKFKGKHENHAIIYPGFKGRPESAIFTAFHEHFRREVRAAKALIFIGFAFRDPYINEILSEALMPGARCAVINPTRTDFPVKTADVQFIDEGFGESSVEKAIAWARAGAL